MASLRRNRTSVTIKEINSLGDIFHESKNAINLYHSLVNDMSKILKALKSEHLKEYQRLIAIYIHLYSVFTRFIFSTKRTIVNLKRDVESNEVSNVNNTFQNYLDSEIIRDLLSTSEEIMVGCITLRSNITNCPDYDDNVKVKIGGGMLLTVGILAITSVYYLPFGISISIGGSLAGFAGGGILFGTGVTMILLSSGKTKEINQVIEKLELMKSKSQIINQKIVEIESFIGTSIRSGNRQVILDDCNEIISICTECGKIQFL